MSTLSKRDFLVGAGATVALGVMGGTARAARHTTFDLIVVGGGNAGLPTAIFAAERGARVAIVEAAGILGGGGNRAHQPNPAPAINQAKPARGDLSAQRGGSGGIFRAGTGGGAGKNTNAAHGLTPLLW